MWKKITAALFVLMCLSEAVHAQSTPGFYRGFVPTAAQWNSYFALKQDVLGYIPLSTLGGTMQGRLTTFASAAAGAGFNVPHGTAPSSPVNGDVWTTTAGMFAQINGSTVGPFGTGLGGTVTVPQGGTGQTTFTANLPLIGAGASVVAQGTRSGNTTSFATTSGTMTSGQCVSIDGSGNLVAAGGACTTGGGGGTVASSTIGQVAVYSAATTVTGIAACNNGYYGTDGAGAVLCRTSFNTTLSATITSLGTVATGVWQGTTIAAQYGGTGVNNGASTITIGGSLTFSGAFSFTATLTASTSPTFPSGTYSVATQTGTSGGIPYYSSATTMASSGALGANLPVFGGGAGSAPIAGTRSGNTTEVVTTTGSQTSGNCVSIDANGNHIDSGVACGSSPSSVLLATLSGGGTSYTDTTHFTSTYSSYTIVIDQLIPSSSTNTNNNCLIQVMIASVAQTSGYVSNSTNPGQLTAATPTTGVSCTVGFGVTSATYPTNAGLGVSGSFLLAQPNFGSSGKATITGQSSYQNGASVVQNANFGGFYNTNGVINGIQISFTNNSSTITSSGITSGTVKIYGNN